jgi:hypothetical protein
MTASANPFQACIDVLVSPSAAFSAVKEHKGWSWLPFILVITATVGLFLYYFNTVDFTWLKEQMLAEMAANGSSEEEIATTAENYTLEIMKWSTVIGSAVGFVLINLVVAIYYHLVTKMVVPNDYKFTDWYGFTWWAAMPGVIGAVVSILVVFFSSNGQVSMHDLQPASLNSLIFSVPAGSAWFNFLESLNLFNFWSLAIAAIGFKTWLNTDNKKATMLAISPFVLIYGSWALYIAFN